MELLVISILHVLVNFCNWPCKSLKSYSFSPIHMCPWCLDLSVFLLTKACPSRSHQSSVTTFGISYLGLGFGTALNNLNLMLSVLGKPSNIEFFRCCNWLLCCASLMGGLWVKKRYLMFCGFFCRPFSLWALYPWPYMVCFLVSYLVLTSSMTLTTLSSATRMMNLSGHQWLFTLMSSTSSCPCLKFYAVSSLITS